MISHKTLEQRFWEKVDKKSTDECWNWTAVLSKHGYGQFNVKGIMKQSYRYSWEIHNGLIPNGLFVLHKCDNRACVNPNHLFLGTQLDNIKDRDQKDRQNKPKGTSNGRSKLTEEQVIQIRNKLSIFTVKQLSIEYNVSTTIIYNIRDKKLWSHI